MLAARGTVYGLLHGRSLPIDLYSDLPKFVEGIRREAIAINTAARLRLLSLATYPSRVHQ